MDNFEESIKVLKQFAGDMFEDREAFDKPYNDIMNHIKIIESKLKALQRNENKIATENSSLKFSISTLKGKLKAEQEARVKAEKKLEKERDEYMHKINTEQLLRIKAEKELEELRDFKKCWLEAQR